MPPTRKVTTRSKVLAGPELDRAIVQMAMLFPEHVGTNDVDGRFMPGTVPVSMLRGSVPAPPLRTGALPAIDPTVLAARWEQARDRLLGGAQRVTLETMAEELGISPETAKRYRKQYGLPLRQ